jgi:multisubunit Na+/H+ antiporter MnhC subunit
MAPTETSAAKVEGAKPAEPPRLAEEMAKLQDEPLLPVEKKLIVTSLLLGVALLGLLWLLSNLLFPR